MRRAFFEEETNTSNDRKNETNTVFLVLSDMRFVHSKANDAVYFSITYQLMSGKIEILFFIDLRHPV